MLLLVVEVARQIGQQTEEEEEEQHYPEVVTCSRSQNHRSAFAGLSSGRASLALRHWHCICRDRSHLRRLETAAEEPEEEPLEVHRQTRERVEEAEEPHGDSLPIPVVLKEPL